MTSEVVILNKKGIVVAADSAVTTGVSNENHPRYSKAANKIFDASVHGNVAITIFGNAEIDSVPWELVLKEYRDKRSTIKPLTSLKDYSQDLAEFLKGHARLFPAVIRTKLKRFRLSNAMVHVLGSVDLEKIRDDQLPLAERQAAWTTETQLLRQRLDPLPIHPSLTRLSYDTTKEDFSALEAELTAELSQTGLSEVVLLHDLYDLAVDALFKEPTEFLSYTGLVIAGYGLDDIFPQYQCVHVFGHIGDDLLVSAPPSYLGASYAGQAISHDDTSWIQAFAQSSMIDVFTDGFGYSLRKIIRSKAQMKMNALVDALRGQGIDVPQDRAGPVVQSVLNDFMREWQQENYKVNFQPLRTVISSLSLPEMVHLAENLLTLESLKERVTSPTESVGGPIDVAVVTKAEGLVWIRRKHYFDPELNLRYLSRTRKLPSHPGANSE